MYVNDLAGLNIRHLNRVFVYQGFCILFFAGSIKKKERERGRERVNISLDEIML